MGQGAGIIIGELSMDRKEHGAAHRFVLVPCCILHHRLSILPSCPHEALYSRNGTLEDNVKGERIINSWYCALHCINML